MIHAALFYEFAMLPFVKDEYESPVTTRVAVAEPNDRFKG